MNYYPKIANAYLSADNNLIVHFSNDRVKLIKISEIPREETRNFLLNINNLKSVKIVAGGCGLEWNDDIDLSETELWNLGVECYETDKLLAKI